MQNTNFASIPVTPRYDESFWIINYPKTTLKSTQTLFSASISAFYIKNNVLLVYALKVS